MPKFSGRFRRRRRFLGPGRAPGGRKKVWVTAFYEALNGQTPAGTNEFADLYQLVAPEDYTERIDTLVGTVRRQEFATVVRCVGALEMDMSIGAPGSNGMLWSACLFVRSERAIFNEYGATGGAAYFIHPEASVGDPSANLNQLQPMAWMPSRSWSAAFLENPTLPADCSDFYGVMNRPEQSEPWYFDVKQRRKMKTDDALWMLVSGVYVCQTSSEDSPVFGTCLARTLIFDE